MHCLKCERPFVPAPNYQKVMCKNQHLFCMTCACMTGGRCALCDEHMSIQPMLADMGSFDMELWLRQQHCRYWLQNSQPDFNFLQPDLTRESQLSLEDSVEDEAFEYSGNYPTIQTSKSEAYYQDSCDEYDELSTSANLTEKDTGTSNKVSLYFKAENKPRVSSATLKIPEKKSYTKESELSMQKAIRNKQRSETYSMFDESRIRQKSSSIPVKKLDKNVEVTNSLPESTFHKNCRCGYLKTEFKSVSSSTDSTPCLLPEPIPMPSSLKHSSSSEKILKMSFLNPSPPEILAMYTRCDIKPREDILHDLAKMEREKFMAFVQEKFPEMTLSKMKNLISEAPGSIHGDIIPAEELEPAIPSAAMRAGDFLHRPESELDLEPERLEASSNALRALHIPPQSARSSIEEPLPQFQLISPPYRSMHSSNSSRVYKATELNISRHPLICPVSSCQQPIFVSDITRHVKLDHAKIPMESIRPGRCRNFYIDSKINHLGVNKLQILYLVTDKIEGLGSNEYQDYLPILVMSTKVSLLELSELKCSKSDQKQESFLLIWLTGIPVPELKLQFTLAAWANCGPAPICHCVHSGSVYSIRKSQNFRDVYHSGHAMLLSAEHVRLLTNNQRHLIEFQIVIN